MSTTNRDKDYLSRSNPPGPPTLENNVDYSHSFSDFSSNLRGNYMPRERKIDYSHLDEKRKQIEKKSSPVYLRQNTNKLKFIPSDLPQIRD